MTFDRQALQEQLVIHEGLRLHVYLDSVGKLTIGVGHNLTDKGIREQRVFDILNDDIDDTVADLTKALPWVTTLDPIRQQVFVNMAFNLGVAGLLHFHKFLAAVLAGNWQEASDQMLYSKWAGQVGQRALDLAAMMREGTPDGTVKV